MKQALSWNKAQQLIHKVKHDLLILISITHLSRSSLTDVTMNRKTIIVNHKLWLPTSVVRGTEGNSSYRRCVIYAISTWHWRQSCFQPLFFGPLYGLCTFPPNFHTHDLPHSRQGSAWILSMLTLGRLVTLLGSPLTQGLGLQRQECRHMKLETPYLVATDGVELLQDISHRFLFFKGDKKETCLLLDSASNENSMASIWEHRQSSRLVVPLT